MTHTADRYRNALRPLTRVVQAVGPGAWDAASPCEGWSARDVVQHMVDTQREILSGQGADLGPAPDVAAGPPGAWREHTDRVLEALADQSLTERAFDGFFGPTTVGATFEQFYVWDMYVHRWDLARAAGLDTELTDAELDDIEQGADSFGDALYMEGICRPPVAPPAGADRATHVLARLGRTA